MVYFVFERDKNYKYFVGNKNDFYSNKFILNVKWLMLFLKIIEKNTILWKWVNGFIILLISEYLLSYYYVKICSGKRIKLFYGYI